MKKLLLLPILFIALASVAQTRLTIQSDSEKCAIISSYEPTNPLEDQAFAAGRFKKGPFYTWRSLLQFNLSSIPKGSFVNWARLNLFGGGNVLDGGPNSFLLLRVNSGWDMNTVTWNTQPGTTKRGQVRLPRSNSPLEDYKNINVTNLVQAMVDSPSNSFGFEIKIQNEAIDTATWISFSSPAFNKPHKNPKLLIEYTTPGFHQKTTSLSVGIDGERAEMNIYPNPCHGIFSCDIRSVQLENMELKVMDVLGRMVYTEPVNASNLAMRISLPASSAGTYFVVLQNSTNETIVSQELQVN